MQTFVFLLPQIILFLTSVVVFGLDLVVNNEKKWLPYLALGGTSASLAVAVYLIVGAAPPTEPILEGMLALDSFALFFQIFAALVAGVVIISSLNYIRDCTPYSAEFYSLLLFASIAVALVAAASDLIMIYVAFELLSITSYILTGYLRDDPKSTEAAVKFFLYGAMASAVMLYGMSLLYGVTGSTNLSTIASVHMEVDASLQRVILPAIILILVGFGFKIAAVPFHQWAPDAYEGAPTPVTAFLSVGPKAAGFAVLMRVLSVALPGFHTDWVALLSALSMTTMTLGNLVAISQKNIKRMLAYSSIAQAGYMLMGVASWNLWQSANIFDGISGVLFYLLVYLFANLGAFSTVIAFERSTGSNNIEDYAGLMQRSPFLAGTMIVFLLSLVGIPGTGGFIGKFFIFGAAIRAEFYGLVVVAALNSIISAFYYLNVARYMFFEPSSEKSQVKPSLALKVALVVNCVLVLVLGLYAQPFLQLVQKSLGFLSAL